MCQAQDVAECALPVCYHDEASCALAVLHPGAQIDLRAIYAHMVAVEQAKEAAEMLRRATELKRLLHEWEMLEATAVCLAESTEDDRDPLLVSGAGCCLRQLSE